MPEQHQKMGRTDGAGRQDHLALCPHNRLDTVTAIDGAGDTVPSRVRFRTCAPVSTVRLGRDKAGRR